MILDYFYNIYSSDHPFSFEASLRAVSQQVTPEMNDELLSDFKEDDVRRALDQMYPTKPPA